MVGRATSLGCPLWITAGRRVDEPRQKQHNFDVRCLKEGARIDFYRGEDKDDLLNWA